MLMRTLRAAQAVLRWLQGLLPKHDKYRIVIELDIPDQVPKNRLVLVGQHGSYWLAMMLCPCGCGATIQLPLTGRSGSRWRVTGARAAPSLHPSVDRTVGCKSHFWLRAGRVHWC